MSSRKYDINEAYLQALQEMQISEARSHKEDNEKAAPRTVKNALGNDVETREMVDVSNPAVGNKSYHNEKGNQYWGTTEAEYASKRNKTGQKNEYGYDVYLAPFKNTGDWTMKADRMEPATATARYQYQKEQGELLKPDLKRYRDKEKRARNPENKEYWKGAADNIQRNIDDYDKKAKDIIDQEREKIANKQNKEEAKEILDEKKKYWPPVYHEYEVDGHTFEFKCQYYEVSGSSQASLWGHDVELNIDGNAENNVVIPYYNRTWETWEFQTAMLHALSKYQNDYINGVFKNNREQLGTRGLKADQKEEILANDEWYQTIQKVYDLIRNGDKGKVEESKKAKTEGQLWGEDRNYDKKMNQTMQEFANQLVNNLTSSGWDYDDSSAKYGTYKFKKGNTTIKYCDNFDKVGIADIEIDNPDILKSLSKELNSDYYDGNDYVMIDFRWGTPNITNIVSILNKVNDIKTEDVDDEENEDEDFDPMDETISLFAMAYREVPEVGVEEWGKDDEYLFCLDTKKFLADLEGYEVEIPKSFYNENYNTDWSNGIDEYLETYVGIDPDSGEDDNTYNWGSRLTHDLNLHFYEAEDGFYVAIEIHKSGDVRGNYTTRFLLRFDDKDDWYEACFEAQANNKNEIELDGKHYTIEPDFWSEHCNIWCEEDQNGWDEIYCENKEELRNLIANEEPMY